MTRRRALTTALVTLLSALVAPLAAEAQPGATGPVAELNAEARATSETDPDRSLATALKAQAAAREARDIRGEAEALNYVAYGYRNQSLLDVARQSALESVRLYVEAGEAWGGPGLQHARPHRGRRRPVSRGAR